MGNKPEPTTRELVIKSKLYRFFGLMFAGVGVLIFLAIFFQGYGGDIGEAAKEPTFILIVLIPFMPALVLSWVAGATEKKALASLEKDKQNT